jgi:hypothetical protein
MDQDPLKQLQSFLDERGGVLEKIASIQSTLGSLDGDLRSPSNLQPAPDVSFDAAATVVDAHYRRLLQALQEMQTQIEQRVRPAVQLVVQNQVDQLRGQSDEKMAALRDCLGQIDRSVVQCLAGLDEYQNRYADLDTINKNLTGLGASPEPLPAKVSAEHLSETISARLTASSQKGRR